MKQVNHTHTATLAGTINRLVILFATLLLLLALPAIGHSTTTERPEELRNLLVKAINGSDSFEDRFDAEVWLLDMSNRLRKKIKNDEKRLFLLKNIHYEAKRAELPPELVLSVIHVESNFDRWALSRVGARGLMQIMPFWLDEIGKPGDDLFNVRTNLRFGCTILKYYIEKEKGDLVRGLARYNGSLGSTRYPDKVLNRLADHWFQR